MERKGIVFEVFRQTNSGRVVVRIGANLSNDIVSLGFDSRAVGQVPEVAWDYSLGELRLLGG